ncbi:DUF6438 domain-containing protein [Spirochaetota bacterium]
MKSKENSMFKKLSLERTMCYGTCPVYTVSVDDNGNIEYYGEMFVSKAGSHKWKVPKKTVTALNKLLTRYKFLSFKNSYTEYNATDMPSAIITIKTDDGKKKRVEHYHGDFNAPEELNEIEDSIDCLLGTDRYVYSKPRIYHFRWNRLDVQNNYYSSHIVTAKNINAAIQVVPLASESNLKGKGPKFDKHNWIIEKIGTGEKDNTDMTRVIQSTFICDDDSHGRHGHMCGKDIEEMKNRYISIKNVSEKAKIITESLIAGTFACSPEKIEKHLKINDFLIFQREPYNIYDNMAIAVYDKNINKLGYIPKEINSKPAELMDGGLLIFGKLKSKGWDNNNLELEIEIYRVDS